LPVHAVQPDPIRPDAQTVAIQADAIRPEATKTDAIRPEAMKTGAMRAGAMKAEATRADAGGEAFGATARPITGTGSTDPVPARTRG
jgi:hypothetical protein